MKIKVIEININQEIQEYPELTLCLGFFDALHLGHQYLINEARKNSSHVGVLSFDNSPKSSLLKYHSIYSLTSPYDKALILDKLNVEYLFLLHFDESFSLLSKDEFIFKILKKINPKKIYCGSDYHFGFNALGDAKYLESFFDVCIIDNLCYDNQKISSRDIKKYIQEGKLDLANKLLGRPYQITGLVVEGNKNGRKLGFPTANLKLEYPYVLPKIGAYVGQLILYDKSYYGIISVSTHPTIMELKEPIIEVNILNFDGNLYGKMLSVDFLELIGEIKRFDSIESLKENISSLSKYTMEKYLKKGK